MSEEETKLDQITFHNKISPNFRELHVDGAYGGITPRGFLNLNFYAERRPIPKSSDFKIISESKVGDKIRDSDDSKTGILREYEFGIYMDVRTAKQLVKFLTSRIEEVESLMKNASDAKHSDSK
jgi:hypothetical protein